MDYVSWESMSGSIKSKENFLLLSFWRLMSRVNSVQEIIISGEIKPRRIKSQGNSCREENFGGKPTGRKKFGGKMGPSLLYYIKVKIEFLILQQAYGVIFFFAFMV